MSERPICFILDMHAVALAVFFACENTGNTIAARIAMIEMTTKSSISVKALFGACRNP